MDTIASEARDILDNLRNGAAPKQPCVYHATEYDDPCPRCVANRQRERQEMIDQAVATGFERLERLPARYRNAVADEPEVTAWADLFGESAEVNAPGLLLLGATGVGKTHQAYGALRAIVTAPLRTRTGYRPRSFQALTFADMCASLRPHPKTDTESVMKALRTVEILLIDDLAAAKGSDWVEEVTYRVVNGRYEEMKPTIFTTNLTVPQLRDAIGDRIASRLAENCTRVVLKGDDRRRAVKA